VACSLCSWCLNKVRGLELDLDCMSGLRGQISHVLCTHAVGLASIGLYRPSAPGPSSSRVGLQHATLTLPCQCQFIISSQCCNRVTTTTSCYSDGGDRPHRRSFRDSPWSCYAGGFHNDERSASLWASACNSKWSKNFYEKSHRSRICYPCGEWVYSEAALSPTSAVPCEHHRCKNVF